MLHKIIYKVIQKLNMFRWNYKYDQYRKKYDIAKTFRFNGQGILFYQNGDLIIGENSYIGRYSTIQIMKGNKVTIGKNCSISHYLKIYTMNSIADQDFRVLPENRLKRNGDVVIGNYCWIGANVFITESSKIGENTVIGANSVVTRDLPSYSICGGIPAKVIKFKTCLSEEEKKKKARDYYEALSEKLKKKYANE